MKLPILQMLPVNEPTSHVHRAGPQMLRKHASSHVLVINASSHALTTPKW